MKLPNAKKDPCNLKIFHDDRGEKSGFAYSMPYTDFYTSQVNTS